MEALGQRFLRKSSAVAIEKKDRRLKRLRLGVRTGSLLHDGKLRQVIKTFAHGRVETSLTRLGRGSSGTRFRRAILREGQQRPRASRRERTGSGPHSRAPVGPSL